MQKNPVSLPKIRIDQTKNLQLFDKNVYFVDFLEKSVNQRINHYFDLISPSNRIQILKVFEDLIILSNHLPLSLEIYQVRATDIKLLREVDLATTFRYSNSMKGYKSKRFLQSKDQAKNHRG